ncbi:hypothetical protein SAMN05443572_101215 [Myxococcus fulvus]|uniref:Outer membrane protein beta-barrel domain-containing protein n=1 Tax=Myxococcus fulvus TaxID=33 RepID=A0A511T0S9_MYXFU|nr:hypothetical protein [Myxococcus fulvus]GEN07760.1 hypothetical protein MFU01_27970 [Myxococcus fulvus]SES80779.1 hypothetical protein SAMN05443572_101215 [Myxococcus fulvus]
MRVMPWLCLVLLSSAVAHADSSSTVSTEAVPRETVVGLAVNPMDWGSVMLEGERVVGPHVSVGLGLLVGVHVSNGSRDLETTEQRLETRDALFQLGAVPRVRFFLSGAAPEGLWVSPQLEVIHQWRRYEQFVVEDQGNESSIRSLQLGGAALVGYTAILGRGLAVQAGVGAGVRHSSDQYEDRQQVLPDGERNSTRKGRSWTFDERLQVSLGWAF